MGTQWNSLRALCVGAGLSVLTVATQTPAAPRPSPTISEEMYIRIGGIDQWVTIKGANRDNPVLLFLHGGPGNPYSPFATSLFAGWEKDFTIVQWDQRGAGRTYGKNGSGIGSTMTVEQMVKDGIEVAGFLTHHLHKRKIILVGGSWGSLLGISMAHKRPDLFYAYVGEAQMVNWQKNVRASYERVLDLARTSGDQAAVDGLTAIGPPPWNALAIWPRFRKWQRVYQSNIAKAPEPEIKRSPEYDSDAERKLDAEGDDFSFLSFVGPTMSGPLTRVDLPALGSELAIPIFIIQGEQDLIAVPELAKAYFDSIRAPLKKFYTVPLTGHEPSVAALDRMHRMLLEEVRPLASGSARSTKLAGADTIE